nr:hypothetical protein DM860_008214 [Ipomoea trifida]
MGKSPAKWFKSILGKKGSKSGTSKKSARNKGSLASAKEPAFTLSVDPPLIPEPLPDNVKQIEKDPNSEKGEAAKSLSDEVVNTSTKHDDDAGGATTLSLPEDSQKLRLEEAATKAQAAFRGYLARQEFQTLKGIIKLQAVIRGHLVRRQAVATLYSLLGIVKIQAVIRGQLVRQSNVESGVLIKQTLGNQALGYSKTKTPIPPEQLLKNVFTEKLLSSSPSAMPLQLQHGPGEPNSAHEWLMRWTVLQVWVADSQPKEISNSKDQGGKKDQAIHNQSGRRLRSDKIENGSSHPNVESEKVKSNTKKIPHHSLKSISEHQGNEIEKVKRNLKKISKPILESSVKSEVDTDSSMQNLQKSTSTLALELSEKGGNTPCCGPEKPADLETQNLQKSTSTLALELSEKGGNTPCCGPEKPADLETLPEGLPMATSVNELCSLPADIETFQSQVGDTNGSRQNLTKSFCTEALELSEGCDRTPTIEPTKPADVETLPEKLSNLALITELCDTPASKIKPEPVADKNEDITTPDKGVNNNHEQNEDENIKHNQRRASLPLKNDVDVGMRTARKVPSYMAPTQSARAKVREQASPRFEQEVLENNALTRRYSMPSSTNGKMSSSPQHQRLVQACGREGIKIDRSLSSSRDGAG